ncbi:bifunctional diaminohydroxyphosphoribosylaminopyrimidine deaminase/5-amino-6-(5-phosphoribosylamino)uracil reductase RibD [Aquabacterium sp.]|uniref:bifunctional diaminohydroxyphosphoribosylaminopyrimidine deaminase/5-amino-6-(5-phosphoribosylamino)uracil reductase RibD n=1 Tax=Aquabacterium sp. TaxID=1872578 RepID=UPI003784C1E8
MALTPADIALLQRSVDLGRCAIGLSDPNPRVGCVLHDAEGRLVGEGFTQQAGGPHAEVMALRAAAAAGHDLRGGTAWVSLEPCAHHGRTPPCCDALIAAGLARVVVATTDPFPLVSGQGIARLRAAGIQVDVADGAVAQTARELNIGFFSRVLRGRPWVRMKAAASLDGRTALPSGTSQWITGPEARADGHRWRRRAGAVLTGIGTVRADDPRLDVRLVDTAKQPLRVVLDSGFATPPAARLLAPPGEVLVVGATDTPSQRIAALHAAGAQTLVLPDGHGQVDLQALMPLLADRGVNELHVEAGARLNGALLQAGLVDELLIYLAPKLLGPGRDIAALLPLSALSQAITLRFVAIDRIGDDLAVLGRLVDRDAFLT